MKYIAILLLAISLVSCTHSSTKVRQDVTVLEGFKAHQYSDIYFSAQPPLKQFRELKRNGFATIINLRKEKEESYREGLERKAAQLAGLNYVNIPVDGKSPLTDEKINKITQAVVKTRKEGKTLVHCSTGNRAALWAGGHFYKDHAYTKADSLKVAKKLGLDKEVPLKNLEKYLENKK